MYPIRMVDITKQYYQQRTQIIFITPFDALMCSTGDYDEALEFLEKSIPGRKWLPRTRGIMKPHKCIHGKIGSSRTDYWFIAK